MNCSVLMGIMDHYQSALFPEHDAVAIQDPRLTTVLQDLHRNECKAPVVFVVSAD